VVRSGLRVLQVIGSANRGGVETWLLRILPLLRAGGVQIDLLVHGPEEGDYEGDFRRLGCAILRCGDHRRAWRYIPAFLGLLREGGPYDVVHGQMYLLSGLHLALAHLAGVPHRIAHMHPVSDVAARTSSRALYQKLMVHAIAAHATCMMYPSQTSARAFQLLGPFAHLPQELVPNCVDVAACGRAVDRESIRRRLGLPNDRQLVAYVGRFVAHKNHALVFAIADELARRGRHCHFALAGSHGDCLAALRERAQSRHDVSLLVGLSDIAPLLLCADAFILPSLEEGFGVVAIEAQAAGLAVVASDLPAIGEALAPGSRSLSYPVNDANAAAGQLERVLGDEALRRRLAEEGRAFSARFSIAASAQGLLDAYRRCRARRSGQGGPAWIG
jgi:glycosyltransferase involved in cell wall biosynthesis